MQQVEQVRRAQRALLVLLLALAHGLMAVGLPEPRSERGRGAAEPLHRAPLWLALKPLPAAAQSPAPATPVPTRAARVTQPEGARTAAAPTETGSGLSTTSAPDPVAITARAAASAPEPPASAPPLRIDRQTLRGIRAPHSQLRHAAGGQEALRETPDQRLGRAIEDASIPSCVRPEAMSQMPIALGGVLGLPFWAAAAATGRCN